MGIVNSIQLGKGSGSTAPTMNGPPPKNNLIAAFGDSRSAQVASASFGIENYGYMHWAKQHSGQRVVFKVENNFGVGGDTTAMVLARIQSVLNSDAGIVVLLAGTNDRSNTDSATSIANLEQIVKQLTDAGLWVILIAELPRGDTTYPSYTLNEAMFKEHLKVRKWCLDQSGRRLVKVVDIWPYWAARGSTYGQAKVGMTVDGLHCSVAGSDILGYHIAQRIIEILPAAPEFPEFNNWSLYDAVNNPYGWLNTNPGVGGVGGSLGSGGSGQLADGYSGANGSTAGALTRTYSKTADGYQRVVLGGAANSAVSQSLDLMRLVGVHGTPTVGRKIEAMAEYELAAGHNNLMSVELGFQYVLGGTTYYLFDGDRYSGLSELPERAIAGLLRIPPLVVPDGLTDLRVRLTVYVLDSSVPVGEIIVKGFGWRYSDV